MYYVPLGLAALTLGWLIAAAVAVEISFERHPGATRAKLTKRHAGLLRRRDDWRSGEKW